MTNVEFRLHEEATEEIATMVSHLQRAGLKVDRVFGFAGLVTGRVEEQYIGALRQIEGVASVDPEEDRRIRLPPSHALIQ